MEKAGKFVISRPLYAVDPGTFRIEPAGNARVAAVWFTRKRGITRACTGYLWNYLTPRPDSITDFLLRHDDNRYGGHCEGRWDGTSYFSHDGQVPGVYEQHMALLVPMLEHVGDIPGGYDGWWGFRSR